MVLKLKRTIARIISKILLILSTFSIILLISTRLEKIIIEDIIFNFSLNHPILLKFCTLDNIFLTGVIVISMVIFFYSNFYIGTHFKNTIFYWTLFFFVSSIIILIIANNLLIIIIGWDGLGASSFLLIIFYNNLLSLRSGINTFIINRLGDSFLILAFILLINNNNITPLIFLLQSNCYSFLFTFFIIIRAITKRAQIPFSAWLPAAIAAPTPVSSLVHSSTLVTAGIYLIRQFLSITSINWLLSLILASFTISLSLISGLFAYFETDFKKLIAISTLSQLGLLGFILFNINKTLTIFHIISHALFKSLLFLTAGALIFYSLGNQDIRIKSRIKNNFLFLNVLIITTNLSLIGFPFTSGFFSKDSILLEEYDKRINLFLEMLLITACIITVIYTINTILLTNNYSYNIRTFTSYSISKFLIFPILIMIPMIVIFGKLFIFFLDKESYELSFLKKIIGILLVGSGILFNFFYKKIFNSPIKVLYELFLSIRIINWIRNNFFSNKFNNWFIINKIESIWWEIFSKRGVEISLRNIRPVINLNIKYNTIFSFFRASFLIFSFLFIYLN